MLEQVPDLQEFAARLAAGPAFLLLGQSADRDESIAAQYRWSGVYTTRADTAVAAWLRTEWRTIVPVGAMSSTPSRSQTELEVCYLFGGQSLPEAQHPPTNPLQIADARMRCVQELTRLATETITPRGVLVIEGWRPDDDLAVTDLVPALRSLGVGQIHLFSGRAWASDIFISSLVSTGQLVLHLESLDDAVSRLAGMGAILIGAPSGRGHGSQHVIAIGDGFVEIDVHTWNQIRRSARPVDLELLTPSVLSSEAARYQEFRNFTGATEGSPHWRGIAAGMNIRRDFEDDLARRVEEALADPELLSPVILRGQTATGKSVALAALAMELARGGEWAVLHQSRRTVRPSFDDVDMYAAWAERHGAKATILIWDGMVDTDEYAALLRQLRRRGRKMLVVGSGYVVRDRAFSSVDAPAELSSNELTQLLTLLKSFDINVRAPKATTLDASFLAFLYHALPDSHFTLTRGLAREMRAAERGMEKLVRKRGVQASQGERITAMKAALQAAGLNLNNLLPGQGPDEKPILDQTFEERHPIQRVTTLVLTATRHGVPVPIDLALRILGREGAQAIQEVLNSFDIIRDVEDDNGELFLAIRTHLEAELLARHEVSLEVEIEVITEVIRKARINEGYTGVTDEVGFVVSLLERIGPKSKISRYRPHYGEISAALADRRVETGRYHPRLVLQESNFARDFVHWCQDRGDGTVEERIADLEHNRVLLDEMLSDGRVKGQMRLSLSVELASTLGSITHEVSSKPEIAQAFAVVSGLDDILQAVLEARAIDPGNLYPVDVLAWSTRDAIKTNMLSPRERLNRLTIAIATLTSVDRPSLTGKQQADLDRRGAELNKLLADDEALWANLRSLEANADPAAVYFLAKFEADEGPEGEAKALRRLEGAPLATRRDWRCAQLLLDLTWKKITGQRLLRGDRTPVHLSQTDLDTLLRLTTDLGDAELPDRHKLAFVKALALFISGDYAEAKHLFHEVNWMTQQLTQRLHTLVLLGDESGRPKIFTGRVEWADEAGGEVWVNELSTKIHFEPHRFSASQQFTKQQPLPAFIIGFKLTRGPVAEPRSLYYEKRSR
ncbi:P-loop NTPase [Streptosporangium sp. H16]|uniref:P-loop NTPase n=1 Tax=Streptosporangium sp. H16 TaxID=3444184 RepID=UPI003F790FCB